MPAHDRQRRLHDPAARAGPARCANPPQSCSRRRTFLSRGSADEIDAVSRVRKFKVTAQHFATTDLFEACVRRAVSMMEQGLIQSPPKGTSLPDALFAMGVPLLRFLTSEQMVAFDRSLAVEACRHPELATRFFEAGPYYCRSKLAEMITAARARGEVAIDDPVRGAEDLVGLWLGLMHKELAMGRVPSPTTQSRHASGTDGVCSRLSTEWPIDAGMYCSVVSTRDKM